ncbi:hypothetical protein ABXV18_27165 [Vibrio owensii]|uniref:hypothetical protein n=1 Tax=Vibrio owensii TaxID=696485 RepID=UPI003396B929
MANEQQVNKEQSGANWFKRMSERYSWFGPVVLGVVAFVICAASVTLSAGKG